jgi:hypothetical protein
MLAANSFVDASGYIISAVITGGFGVFLAWQNRRLHKEVRTNHGKRNGERMEELGDDVSQIKRTMVTGQDLRDHADHDLIVARQLSDADAAAQKYAEETRAILLAAINGGQHGK